MSGSTNSPLQAATSASGTAPFPVEGVPMSAPKKVSPPCSKRLRSNLLNKLGIVELPQLAQPRQKTVLGDNIKIIKAPLKRDEGPDPLLKSSGFLLGNLVGSLFRVGSPSSVATMDSDDASCSQSSATKRGLTFDEEVSVVHIPRREQYSKRIQEHLWHSTEVLRTNVARNTVEYAADGWKWQDVREEEEHIVCEESGELIHPVHQEIARLIREEQGLPEDTPVWTPFLKHAPLGGCTASATTTATQQS